MEYKVFNLSNGLLIFATFSLSLDFVIDVFMTLETLVKFKGWSRTCQTLIPVGVYKESATVMDLTTSPEWTLANG